MNEGMTRDEIVRALKRAGVPPERAERYAAMEIGVRDGIRLDVVDILGRGADFPPSNGSVVVDVEDPEPHWIVGDKIVDRTAFMTGKKFLENVILSNGRAIVPVLTDAGATEAWGELLEPGGVRMSVPVPPRTKKNGGRRAYFGIARKGSAYAGYRDAFCQIVGPIVTALRLPLPADSYNLAAQFYVDSLGRAADRFGLEQALADVLQLARIVTNDWQFRTGDGTRIIAGDEHPRVEFTITPLENANGERRS